MLDLKSGYREVEIYLEDGVHSRRDWQLNMPFRMYNAQATAKCLMKAILQGLNGKSCLVYVHGDRTGKELE